jgi:hypothetical protein
VLLLGTLAFAKRPHRTIVVGNTNSSANQTQSISETYSKTCVVCDQEASGSVDVYFYPAGLSDGLKNTITLTSDDRDACYTQSGLSSVVFDSGDTFTCIINQTD